MCIYLCMHMIMIAAAYSSSYQLATITKFHSKLVDTM